MTGGESVREGSKEDLCALQDLCQAPAKSCLPSASTEFAQKRKRVGFIALPPHGMSQRLDYPAIPVDFSLKFFYPDHSARSHQRHA